MKIDLFYAYFPDGKSIILNMMRLAFLLFFTVSFGFTPLSSLSQDMKVSLNSDKTLTIDEIFDLIEEQTSYRFVYPSSLIKGLPKVDVKKGTTTVKDLLGTSFLNAPVDYEFRNKKNIVLTEAEKSTVVRIKEEQQQIITGTVTDEDGVPLPGVNITVEGTARGTQTDFDGNYTIDAEEGEVLHFSFVGFTERKVMVNDDVLINISLKESTSSLDEVVVVGYGTVKKGSNTGAISGIKGSDMIKTKNENPQNMLTGRIPGVRVWQKSSEPGDYNTNFDIRGLGAPLIVIDGITRNIGDFQRLNANDIEDISVLKDASAAIYGNRSANGVVLVTTKRGKKGEMKVEYNGSYTIQKPSGMPRLADPIETMKIYNEAAMNDINGGSLIYTEEDFRAFENGTRKDPNWNSLIIANQAPQTKHDISISGGEDKLQYYIGGGYLYQEGIFRSGDLNYDKYNIQSNIDAEITKGLDLQINISGMVDNQNKPYTSSVDIIRNYWKQGPLIPAFADSEETLLNYEGLDLEQNTVAFMDSDISGYRRFKKKSFESSASLNFDFGSILEELEGLSIKGLFSYDYHHDDNRIFRREYFLYAYDQEADQYKQKLYDDSSPSRLTREMFKRQQLLSQFLLNYEKSFHKHSIKGMLGWEIQKNDGDNFFGRKDLAFNTDELFAGVEKGQKVGMDDGIGSFFDEAKSALIGRLNYEFEKKYLAEFQFRYDGSSRFAKNHRWGFFPSGSLGWRISEESFLKSSNKLSFINELKIRASYGVLGDDLAGGWNFEWLPGYTYPATSGNEENGYYNQYAPGYIFDGDFITAMVPKAIANEDLTWYKAKTFNVGVDFEGWNGLFGFTFDYFTRERTGMFERQNSLLPTVVGSTAPLENVNSDRVYGLELELSHRNNFGDFDYNINGIITLTRKKNLTAVQNGPYKNSYDKWRHDNLTNRFQGMQFGYESAGRFEDWEDIWNYPLYKERDVLPGDYKYEDWNGDGEINGLDEHPIAYDQTPWLNYSLNLGVNYKNFDLSMLFQGSALGSMEYREPLYSIWGENGGGTLTQYTDRWHPVDPKADPYDPNTEWVEGYYAYTGNYPKGNSKFNRVSMAYLRLKSIELGYTLPEWKALPRLNLRLFVNAYNIWTITNVKFVDPEHPDDDLGRLYPLNKTYTFGMSLSF